MHAEAANVEYYESFSMLSPLPNQADLPFTVAAHETAHQWWGHQLMPAPVPGAGLLAEGLAVYSSMQIVEKTGGPEQLRKFIGLLHARTSDFPTSRAGVPLLWTENWFDAYRKGPFALYAMSQYIGEDKVTEALQHLFESYRSGAVTMPMALDLYRELKAVTPDEMQSLAHDLFAANTWWDFDMKRATAKQIAPGTWQVTLDVSTRKQLVDAAGAETPAKIDDLVEIGIFAPAEKGGASGGGSEVAIYQQKHRITSADQTITVTVPRKPTLAGVDPRQLLTRPDRHRETQLSEVKVEG